MTVRNVPSSILSTENGKPTSTTSLDYKLATEIVTTGTTELTAFGVIFSVCRRVGRFIPSQMIKMIGVYEN
ncbi:MAG: hypothetical protein IKT87_02390 [Bacteroidaceae bacterium]|nr:hypothetical protein [Bacteroidaceae bacterium]